MKLQLLGGMTAREFLRDYWHKKPLLVRDAIPGFKGLLSPAKMKDLACNEGVESRLVRGDRHWSLGHGPFRPADFSKLPRRNWTLLVQSLDHHLASGGGPCPAAGTRRRSRNAGRRRRRVRRSSP